MEAAKTEALEAEAAAIEADKTEAAEIEALDTDAAEIEPAKREAFEAEAPAMEADKTEAAETEALDTEAIPAETEALEADAAEMEASDIAAAVDACKLEESPETEVVGLAMVELAEVDAVLLLPLKPPPSSAPLLPKTRESSKAATSRTILSAAAT